MFFVYKKAKNGMMVRIPLDRLEEWQKWQENPDPKVQAKVKEDLKKEIRNIGNNNNKK
ncbi:MAG: hypothetical protein J6V40_04355 [Clostridia bacterium]|nr:hypothetical protein [Clostridia bacterium]